MVGDFLQNTNGNIGKVIGIEYYSEHDDYDVVMRYNEDGTCYSSSKLLAPIPITPDILEKNGWERHEYMYVLKSNPRLGWHIKTHELIIGYHTFPIVVNFVHQLQHIHRMLGIKDIEL